MLRSLKRAVSRGSSRKARLFNEGRLEAHKLTLPFRGALDLKRQPCADDFIISIHGKRQEIDSAYLHQPVYESHTSLVITLSEPPDSARAIDTVGVVYIPMEDGLYIRVDDETANAATDNYVALDAFDENVAIQTITAENAAYAELALDDNALSDADLPDIDVILCKESLTVTAAAENHAKQAPPAGATGTGIAGRAGRDSATATNFDNVAALQPGNVSAELPGDAVIAGARADCAPRNDAACAGLPAQAGVVEKAPSRSAGRDVMALFNSDDWVCELNEHRVFLRLPVVLDLRYQPLLGDFIICVDDQPVHCSAALTFCEAAGERPSLVFFLDRTPAGKHITIDYTAVADSLRLVDGKSIAPFSFSQCLVTYRTSVGLIDPILATTMAGDAVTSGAATGFTHTSLELDPRQYREDGWEENSWHLQTQQFFSARPLLVEQEPDTGGDPDCEHRQDTVGDDDDQVAAVAQSSPKTAPKSEVPSSPASTVARQLAQANRSQLLISRAMLGTGVLGFLSIVYAFLTAKI